MGRPKRIDPATGTLKCTQCHEVKYIDEFNTAKVWDVQSVYWTAPDGTLFGTPHSKCRDCFNTYQRTHRETRKAQRERERREWELEVLLEKAHEESTAREVEWPWDDPTDEDIAKLNDH